jgi:isoleucyl-tRNA synthetase
MATDYKNTLNLPRTDFPMKADLVSREPQRLEKWQQADLYAKIQASRTAAPKFVLHDGPPFANGDVHVGTALNKILKDIIIKYQTLRGKSAPYIPGWDCHGLPIEFKVSQEMRKSGSDASSPADIRKACEVYARKYIDIQRTQFKRLGVLGDWENPYLTLNKEYEADELRLFADIVAKGFVYRGKKPVYWSIPCRTALAEAEVEYHDHVSQSVFVKFWIDVENSPKEIRNLIPQNAFVLIWTTTPWTLPANLAVAFNSNLIYCFIQHETERGIEHLLVSTDLAQKIIEKAGLKNAKISSPNYPGYTFAFLCYEHPFIKRKGQLFAGDNFVTKDTGTGFVHIAPGHGLEDYGLGSSVGLPIYSPVDDDGKFAYMGDLPVEQQMPAEMIGKSILEKHGKSDANEAVLHELRLRHALLHQENYHHSYPHCWRSKTPIIFRAMDQWFIEIDHKLPEWIELLRTRAKEFVSSLPKSKQEVIGALGIDLDAAVSADDTFGGLRSRAVSAIESEVHWIPDWGQNRIKGAVQSRPDWCISRQRTWGVPIPAFYDAKGEAILDAQIVRNAADLIEKHGSNIWFEKSATELWSLVKPANWIGAEAVAKSNDTLDVWIDSGSSSRAVLKQRKELQHDKKSGDEVWQADVYLEGSDQHRGWFQSSLLLSLAGNGAAPFKTVLTHGFMVDADREKISKSKQGAYEKPQTAEAYVKKYGADVVRLWVASQDYRSDIVVSEERINKVGETYRGIRNALRYQLSNLYDFDPAKHSVPDEKLTGLDRWILGEFAKLEAEVLAAYDQYEFHVVYQKLSQFIAVELSSVYHDVIKDRLYTDAANSPRRRSTQTALHGLVSGLCQMLAPILAFTADEAWEFIPGKPTESVHQNEWKPKLFEMTKPEQEAWHFMIKYRNDSILPQLEQFRQMKIIGKSLEASIDVKAAGDYLEYIKTRTEELRELMNVSQLNIGILEERLAWNEAGKAVSNISKADGQKCERCWHWETDIGQNTEHPTLCGRCVEAVKQFKA